MTDEKPKAGRPSPKKNYDKHPLTQERVDMFLEVLAETGSKTAAARAASPGLTGSRAGYSTFRHEWERDPAFKEAVDAAYDSYLGKLNHEIHNRAFTPTSRPIFSNGERVGEELKYDNQLLIRVAKRHEPDKWGDRQQVEHTGQINCGVMVIGALPASEEEWEDQYAKAIPAECEEKEDHDDETD